MASYIERFHCIQDSQLGPDGVLYREVPLYCSCPALWYAPLPLCALLQVNRFEDITPESLTLFAMVHPQIGKSLQ